MLPWQLVEAKITTCLRADYLASSRQPAVAHLRVVLRIGKLPTDRRTAQTTGTALISSAALACCSTSLPHTHFSICWSLLSLSFAFCTLAVFAARRRARSAPASSVAALADSAVLTAHPRPWSHCLAHSKVKQLPFVAPRCEPVG